MNRRMAAGLISVVMLAGTAQSRAGDDFYAKAKVISVTPVYDRVLVSQPEEQCWNERIHYPGRGRARSYTPVIAGAIVGGVVGNQFGGGRGRDALTVAGALLGASVGNDLARQRRGGGYVKVERRCETVERYEEQEVLTGYRVKYRYHGREFTTHSKEYPGKRIRVKVDVEPVPRYAYNE